MIIEKNFAQYVVFAEDSIVNALKKISANQSGLVFSLTESGILDGVLSNGDFRRWLLNQDSINLDLPVTNVANKRFAFAWQHETPKQIQAHFDDRIQILPILDSQRRMVAIARKRKTSDGVKIGSFTIDEDSPVFIIAEIGNNHNGRLELAKNLIDCAIQAGANCAKFQMRNLETLYHNAGNPDDASEDLGSQYTLDLLSRFQLSTEDMFAAFDYCRQRGILPLCTPWDIESFELLEQYGIQAYKIASADLTNHDFLKRIAASGKPMFCSTGMSTEKEIQETVNVLDKVGAKYVLLHCNSTYPAPFKDVHLNYLERLKHTGHCPVGYSGHERGYAIALAAAAKGAKVIEKHLTLDKTMEGNDHKVSLLPDEFAAMTQGIRQIEEALGSADERQISQGEIINRETLSKSLVCTCAIAPGTVVTENMIMVKSPGRGLQPNRKRQLIGTVAKRPMKNGDFFFPSDLVSEHICAREFTFSHPWGIPVRYHDFKPMLAKTNPTLLEFHLSYKDLEQDLDTFFETQYDVELVVHSPELFAGDHILDLCASDETYRQHSVSQLQRVIDVTRRLTQFFQNTPRPCIITNVGGFTQESPLPPPQQRALYDILLKSLSQLDSEGVEILPQTMPPFPWHFGGQRYHNLFVEPEPIVEFCRDHQYRICFDVSHSKLACNSRKRSFSEFVQLVGPYSAHLHIADARGLDGEGLQIGDGDIDFAALAEYLEHTAPQASFIPEIWQGHKNEGEGFWIALEKLEAYL